MRKVCLYLRVSTEQQDNEMQRVDVVRYATAHGYGFDIFEEKISGASDSRPIFNMMLGKIKEGHYSHLIVWRMDRASRSVRGFANLLADLETAKCTFVSVKEHLDLSTPTGKLMVSLLSAFSEFELSSNKIRQKAGILNAQARGKHMGRPKTHVTWALVKIEKAKGYSTTEMARRLKCSRRTVERVIAKGGK